MKAKVMKKAERCVPQLFCEEKWRWGGYDIRQSFANLNSGLVIELFIWIAWYRISNHYKSILWNLGTRALCVAIFWGGASDLDKSSQIEGRMFGPLHNPIKTIVTQYIWSIRYLLMIASAKLNYVWWTKYEFEFSFIVARRHFLEKVIDYLPTILAATALKEN